jgi:uncharacterized DUF497 family protein
MLAEPLEFEWDQGNIFKNIQKHNVTTQEAEEIFKNKPFITVADIRHSTERERRYQGLGHTKTNRKLFVAFTIRNKKLRVISIRDMKRKERQAYEQFEKTT